MFQTLSIYLVRSIIILGTDDVTCSLTLLHLQHSAARDLTCFFSPRATGARDLTCPLFLFHLQHKGAQDVTCLLLFCFALRCS